MGDEAPPAKKVGPDHREHRQDVVDVRGCPVRPLRHVPAQALNKGAEGDRDDEVEHGGVAGVLHVPEGRGEEAAALRDALEAPRSDDGHDEVEAVEEPAPAAALPGAIDHGDREYDDDGRAGAAEQPPINSVDLELFGQIDLLVVLYVVDDGAAREEPQREAGRERDGEHGGTEPVRRVGVAAFLPGDEVVVVRAREAGVVAEAMCLCRAILGGRDQAPGPPMPFVVCLPDARGRERDAAAFLVALAARVARGQASTHGGVVPIWQGVFARRPPHRAPAAAPAPPAGAVEVVDLAAAEAEHLLAVEPRPADVSLPDGLLIVRVFVFPAIHLLEAESSLCDEAVHVARRQDEQGRVARVALRLAFPVLALGELLAIDAAARRAADARDADCFRPFGERRVAVGVRVEPARPRAVVRSGSTKLQFSSK